MSEIVKKGYLSVRRKNLLASSSYKQRYVVLSMSGADQGKLVEVWDSQTSEKEPYRLVLGNTWTVHNKPSNSGKRYAFQLLVGDEVVLTFSCSSVTEREEWTNAFDVFRKMALPVTEHPALPTAVTTDDKNYFSVFLSKTHSSVEIHCGQYMLSVANDAICLHWIRTAAIAHRWPRKYVQELSMRGPHLVLKACRAEGSASNVMEFEFRTTNSTTVAILKRWNIVLMESIAANCGDPEQMNYIGKVLNKRVSETPDGGRLTKSFRKRSQSTKEKKVKRSGSFSSTRSATLRPNMLSATPPQVSKSGNNSPQRVEEPQSLCAFSGDMVDAAKLSRMQSSPPPLPPRPIFNISSSEGDSDYAYIEEDEVKGPAQGSHSPSLERGGDGTERTLEEELEELELSIKREKKEKKRKAAQEKRKAATLAARPSQPRPPLPFTPADPEDYLVPLSAFNDGCLRSTGDLQGVIHNRSCSEPDTSLYRDSKSLSQPTIHTLRSSPPRLSPTPEHGAPPPLPSRAWRDQGGPSGRNHDDNISPYAVVRQILPGKILEEPPTHPSTSHTEHTPSPQDQHQPDLPNPSSGQSSVVTESVTPTEPPTSLPSNSAPSDDSTPAPPIPPRSPIKEKLSWGSSTSSIASNHSHRSGYGHAASLRSSKTQRPMRAPVDKTMSEHRNHAQTTPPSSHDLEKSSLPDLHASSTTAGVPENSLQQRRQRVHRGRHPSTTESRSSSDGSTSSLHSANVNYLEMVPDGTSPQSSRSRNSNPESLQILGDFLQYYDDKVSSSLTQSDESPESRKRIPVKQSHTLHSSSQIANGHGPPRRVNGALQRSHTSASVIGHHSPQQHPVNHNKSLNIRAPLGPPIPPRSDVSLGGGQSGRVAHHPPPLHATNYHPRLWGRSGSSGSFSSTSGDSRSPPALYGNRTRQSSSSSIHSGTPSPTIVPMAAHPPPRSWQNLVRHFPNAPIEPEGSATVFIHHLKQNRRVMHSHMV